MRALYSVSAAAIAVSVYGTPALAQVPNTTPANVNVLNLLAPFLGLTGTPVGQQTLQLNLSQGIADNQSANMARQALAISDKALPGSAPFLGSITLANGMVVNLGPADNLAGGLPLQAAQSPGGVQPNQPVGGLGPQLGAIYQTGIRASTIATGPLQNTFALLNNAYNFTSSDLGVAKNYFANGAATNPSTTPPGYVPVPAVAPPGFTLPTSPYTVPAGSPAGAAGSTGTLPNRNDSVLDLAYGVRNTQAGQDVYGSSRPVQVTPGSYNIFDPTALNGLATNPSFPSGHTNYAFTDSYLLALLVPQQYQNQLLRGSEYGDSRIVLGVHYPLDIIASRAFSAYDLAQALTNPAYINNAATTGTPINLPALFTAAQGELQGYLSAQCGNTVATCASSAANTTGNPYVPSAANQATYQARLTYGLPTLTFAQAPREAAPAGGPDASILLATLYGGSTAAAARIAPNGGLFGSLQTSTINQIITNTEGNALAALYGTALSYWSRLDLYSAAGYLGNVTGTLALDPADRVTTNVAIGDGGLLAANGTVTGTVTVGSGGVLGGVGTVGGIVAQAGGTVAPGNSIGTLNVAGNLTFAPGSFYRVEVNAAGQSDRTVATGTATLGGGTVQVLAANGNYAARTRYTILTAQGGVTGGFAGATSNLAFLTPSLSYDSTNAFLTLGRNDVPFAGLAQTRNQAAAANGVQAAGPGTAIYNRVIGLTAAESVTAFTALSGEIQPSAVTAEFETAHLVREAILDRLRGGFAPVAGYAQGASVPAAFSADLPGRRPPATPVPFTVLDPQVFAFWGQGFGSFGETRSDGNAGSLSRDTAGFVAGADVTLDGRARIGIAGGYTNTSLDVRSRLSSGTIDSGFGAIYGGVAFGALNLRAGFVYADNALKTQRTVLFPGFAEAERGKLGGSTVQGFGEIGYKIVLGSAVIEPFVGGAGISIAQDRYTEVGGAAALTGLNRSNDLATLTTGVRGETALDLFGLPLTARGLVGYRHAFGDVVPTALLSFGTAAAPFLTAGVPIDRNAFVAEAGLDYRISPAMKVGLTYAGQVGPRANDNSIRGEFVYRF